jgi:ATP-dependent DNA helicase RecG
VLAEQFGINESAIQKHLNALKDKDIIKRVGTITGNWKINRQIGLTRRLVTPRN